MEAWIPLPRCRGGGPRGEIINGLASQRHVLRELLVHGDVSVYLVEHAISRHH